MQFGRGMRYLRGFAGFGTFFPPAESTWSSTDGMGMVYGGYLRARKRRIQSTETSLMDVSPGSQVWKGRWWSAGLYLQKPLLQHLIFDEDNTLLLFALWSILTLGWVVEFTLCDFLVRTNFAVLTLPFFLVLCLSCFSLQPSLLLLGLFPAGRVWNCGRCLWLKFCPQVCKAARKPSWT